MENYTNLIDPNIEYGNIVYSGNNNSEIHLINPPQTNLTEPNEEMIMENQTNNLKQQNIDDINRQSIIQAANINDNNYHNTVNSDNPNEIKTNEELNQETNHQPEYIEPTNNIEENVESSNLETAVVSEEPKLLVVEPTDDNVVKCDDQAAKVDNEEKPKSPVLEKLESSEAKDDKSETPSNVENSKVKKEEEIDSNQCRVCLSKSDLIDIFMIEEGNLRFSDKILIICPSIQIMKNDFLPHFICASCLTKLKTAYEFKQLCEQTDKELRKKLKRSKNKLRRPTEFILIDCEEFSDNSVDDGNNDDEFHISGSLSEADTSDSNYSTERNKRRRASRRRAPARSSRSARNNRNKSKTTSTNKRKRPSRAGDEIDETPKSRNRRSGGGGNSRSKKLPGIAVVEVPIADIMDSGSRSGRSTAKKSNESPSPTDNKRARREIVLIKATEESDEDDDLPLKSNSKASPKSGPAAKPTNVVRQHNCPYCDRTFTSQNALREHKRTHNSDKPYTCDSCKKIFKQKSNYTAHILKHKDPVKGTMSCEKPKRRPPPTASVPASTTHSVVGAGSGSGGGGSGNKSSTEKKKKSEFEMSNFGRDLFKCVAPLTTTYWSDSFSD